MQLGASSWCAEAMWAALVGMLFVLHRNHQLPRKQWIQLCVSLTSHPPELFHLTSRPSSSATHCAFVSVSDETPPSPSLLGRRQLCCQHGRRDAKPAHPQGQTGIHIPFRVMFWTSQYPKLPCGAYTGRKSPSWDDPTHPDPRRGEVAAFLPGSSVS